MHGQIKFKDDHDELGCQTKIYFEQEIWYNMEQETTLLTN